MAAKKIKVSVSILIILFSVSDLFSQFYGWTPFGSQTMNGTNGTVNAIIKYNGNIVVAGYFTEAGGVPANNIASWSGSSWSALGAGVNDTVFSLSIFSGQLIAGGKFTTAGGSAITAIAKWNGSVWSSLGAGLGGNVRSMGVLNGRLIAGGNITFYNNIASWDGNAWSSLSTGLNGTVYTILPYGGYMFAGGTFTMAGTVSVNKIASWNGSSWSALGTGMNNKVSAITAYGSYIVAGGDFTQAGGNSCQYIARWDGSAWSPYLTSFPLNSPVVALAYYNSALIIGGNFTTAGNLFVNRICKWDGNGCQRLITGTNQQVKVLYVSDTSLYAGGDFTTAGGDYSFHTAKYSNVSTHTISGIASYAYDTTRRLVTGVIKAVRLDFSTREVIVIDSARVQPDGSYQIVNGINDSTDIVAFPNDEQDHFVPTYYPSSLAWVNAVKIYPSVNLNNINIRVIRDTASGTSLSNISGYVFLNFTPPVYQPGFPFSKDAIIYAKQGPEYRSFAITDSTEKYTLRGLSPGNYDLFVDRLGYTSAFRNVTLGTVNLDTINFYLDTLNFISVQPIGSEVPEKFMLHQNYPNPFNPVTRIKFDVPGEGQTHVFDVQIKVYDILGREAVLLVNEQLRPGTYIVSWDASNYPSGIYFYQIVAEGFTETKKMILIK